MREHPARRVVGSMAWALLPLYVVVELAAAVAVSAPYGLLDNTISDLGAASCGTVEYAYGPVEVCSPGHALFNAATVASGALIAVGAVLLRRWLPAGRAVTVSTWLWVLVGASTIGAGLTPLDRDLDVHLLAAFPAFVLIPAALLALGLGLRSGHRRGAAVTMMLAAVTVVAAAGTVVLAGSGDLIGLVERLALWPIYLWLPVVALGLTAPRPGTARGAGGW